MTQENQVSSVASSEDMRQSAHPTTEHADGIYARFKTALNRVFTVLIEEGQTFVQAREGYTLDDLLKIYPEEARAHYNCHVCRQLFERIGSMASFGSQNEPELLVSRALQVAGIADPTHLSSNDVQLTREVVTELGPVLSVSTKGGFEHMFACTDEVRQVYNKAHLNNPDYALVDLTIQRMAAIEFKSDLVRKAHELVKPQLNMPNTIGLLQPYADFIDRVVAAKRFGISPSVMVSVALQREDHRWLVQMQSSNAGNVLNVLRKSEIDENDLRAVIDLINENTSPENYKQMSKDAPAPAVEQAVAFLRENNWSRALERRLATSSEAQVMWSKSITAPVAEEPALDALEAAAKMLTKSKEQSSKMDQLLGSGASTRVIEEKISLNALRDRLGNFAEIKLVMPDSLHMPFVMTAPVDDTQDYRDLFTQRHQRSPSIHFLCLTKPVGARDVAERYELPSREVAVDLIVETGQPQLGAVIQGTGAKFINNFTPDAGSLVIPGSIAMKHYRHARSLFDLSSKFPMQGLDQPDAVGGLLIGIGVRLTAVDRAGVRHSFLITSKD